MMWLLVDYGGVLAEDNVASALAELALVLDTDSSRCRALLSEKTPAGAALRVDDITEDVFWAQVQESARAGARLTRTPAELTAMWAATYRVRESMVLLLKEAQDMGLQVGVATNVDRYREAYLLRSLQAHGLDLPIFSSYRCRAMKPNAAYYKCVTARLLSAPPPPIWPTEFRVLFVDDRKSHTDAAESCGWSGLCTTDPDDIRTRLSSIQ